MSVGIFVYALIVEGVVLALASFCEKDFRNEKMAFAIFSVGSLLFLSLAASAFCFSSFRNLRYHLMYDNVVELEWNPKNIETPPVLDWSKVKWCDNYTTPNNASYMQVIMAWDNEPSFMYDDLVKMQERKAK